MARTKKNNEVANANVPMISTKWTKKVLNHIINDQFIDGDYTSFSELLELLNTATEKITSKVADTKTARIAQLQAELALLTSNK